ncbi:MAG TPA: ATP-binding protein, partial [Bacteroidota bacterium]|nr:ATP-binding protein [Bacteroidota bacterium]
GAVGEMRDALGEGDQIVRSEGHQIARGEGDEMARGADGRTGPGAGDRTGMRAGEQGSPNAANRMAGNVSEDQGSGEEFRQTDRQLVMLGAISQGLAGALDTQSIFALLHEQMRGPLSYRQLTFHEFDPATNNLLPVFEANAEGDGGVAGSTRDALNVDDFPLFAQAVSTKEPWSGEGDEGKSELLVPILSKDRVLGLLRLVRQHGEPFEKADLRIVTSIGNLVAIALERVALHDETVAKAREIAFRNEELDRFTYVVSHDLKEPLITINGYTRLALDGFGESMPDDVKGHLDSVMRASVRMKQLIDDLLTLSRVGREQGQPAVISVAHVVEDLVHDLEFMLQERNAKVEYPDDLPYVRYDPTHLSMVFRNLIVNGVKYNQNAEKLIRIAARREAGAWEFSVSDNGIGIEVRDFQKIFTIFQRLDPGDGAGGTGAGLTIVKKIVESNGGTIRLESEKGRGSTFTFTVPDHA